MLNFEKSRNLEFRQASNYFSERKFPKSRLDLNNKKIFSAILEFSIEEGEKEEIFLNKKIKFLNITRYQITTVQNNFTRGE